MKEGQAIQIGQINPYQFAQLLAKIAYGFAIGQWGYGSFKPIIHPLLKGDAATWTDLVGGDYDIPDPEPETFSLETYLVLGQSARYLCVRIRLWSFVGTPVYRVVVGTA